MNILHKYNLLIKNGLPPRLEVSSEYSLNKTSMILIDLVFSLGNGGLYFNTQQFLSNVVDVKYGIRKTWDYFPEAGRGSIHVTSDIVYITTMEDENQEKRITSADDQIMIDDFIIFLQELLQTAQISLTNKEKILQSVYYDILDIIEKRWIEGFKLLTINNHSVVLLLGPKKLMFRVLDDCKTVKVYDSDLINYKKTPEQYELELLTMVDFISNYIVQLRENNDI